MERKQGGLRGVSPIRGTFNRTYVKEEPQTPKRDYSQKEMVELIDRYAHFAKHKDHKNEMLNIKDRYYNLNMALNEARGVQLKNFDDGLRDGLHTYKDREKLEKQFKLEDQKDRNKTVVRAKMYYHQNYSLSKNFKDSLDRSIEKSKTMRKTKDRDKTR